MKEKSCTLDTLTLGSTAVIKRLQTEGTIRRRLLDIGLIPGTKIESVLRSPFKDPVAYRIRGALIALRVEDAKNIIVEVSE